MGSAAYNPWCRCCNANPRKRLLKVLKRRHDRRTSKATTARTKGEAKP